MLVLLRLTVWPSRKLAAKLCLLAGEIRTCLGLVVLEDRRWEGTPAEGVSPLAFVFTLSPLPWHREKGLKIQWVDDTHALGVFPCLASGNAASWCL